MSGNIYVSPTTGTILPEQYQAVDYIETDGNAYIITQHTLTKNTRTVAKFSNIDTTQQSMYFLFGALEYTSPGYYIGYSSSNGFLTNFGNTNNYIQLSIIDDDKIIIDKNKNVTTISYKSNSQSVILTDDSFTQVALHEVIFGIERWTEGFIEYSPLGIRLHDYKTYENDQLIHHYIPCYRKSDNEIGLYDIIDNIFYTNAGEGNFIKGNNINFIIQKKKIPNEYKQVDYLLPNKTTSWNGITSYAYIDTNVIPTLNMKFEISGFLNPSLFEQYPNSEYIFGSYYYDKNSNFYGFRSYFTNNSRNIFNFVLRGSNSYTEELQKPENIVSFILKCDFKNSKCTVELGEQKIEFNDISFSTNNNLSSLFLFSTHYKDASGSNESSGYTEYISINSCKIYDSEILIHNYVPIIDINNNIAGFYDSIENIGLFPSTSFFSYGSIIENENTLYAQKVSKVYTPIKKIPNEYQEVEYIQNDGNHYIDSEYQPNENTRIYGEFGNISSSTAIAENFFGVNETDKYYWTNFDNQELEPHLQSQIYNEDRVQKEIDFQDFLRSRKIIVEKELDKLKYTLTKTNDLSIETKFSLLPSEYREVEYIRSTGTQYIDLDFIPDQDTGFDLEFMTRNSMATIDKGTILGAEYAKNSRCIKLSTWSETGCTGQFIFNTTINYNILLKSWKKNIVKFRNKVLTKSDGTTLTVSGTFNSDINLYLFADNIAGTVSENSKVFLYHAKFYDGNTLIRDLYPCVRKLDGKPGLYDIVNKVFYTNAAAEGEDFFTSEDLLLPSEYQQVEYIQSTGSQYIVTTADCQNLANTFIECDMSFDTNIYSNHCYPMGGYLNNNGKGMILAILSQSDSNKGVIHYRIGNKTNNKVTAANFNTDIHHFSLDGKQKRIVYDNTFTNLSSVTLTNFEGMLCFFSIEDFTNSIAKGKFYHGKVVINTEVYDYYPCYRKSDGVAGVYDIIHNEFLTNAAETGDDFIIGPAVNPDGTPILPNRYLKLDYIESDGSQYINTSVYKSTSTKLEADIELINTGTKQGIIGSMGENGNNYFGLFIDDNRILEIGLGAGFANISNNYQKIKNRNIYCVDNNLLRVSINGTTIAKTSSAAYSTLADENKSIYLFGNNYYSEKGEYKLYYSKIYETGILTHYYIPCIDKQNNRAGIYDLVEEEFITNNEGNEFINKYNNYYYEIETNPYILENYSNLYISAINDVNDNRVWSSNLKIYRFKIYEKDKIIKNFIPVERKSDNLLGLFDICNQSFHPFETNEEILDNTQPGNNIENNNNTAHIITKVYTSVNNIAKQVYQKTYIPKEYQQVEWIQPNGNSRIDLGFKPTIYTGFEIDFIQYKNVTTSGYGTIFGTRKSATVNQFSLSSYNGGYVGLNNVNISQLGMLKEQRQFFSLKQKTAIGPNKSYTFSSQVLYPAPNNLHLFTMVNNTAGSFIENGNAKIYSLKFYNGYKKQNDYYPCYRINDGAIGFYDRISKQFITQTAGTLIKGNNFVKRL